MCFSKSGDSCWVDKVLAIQWWKVFMIIEPEYSAIIEKLCEHGSLKINGRPSDKLVDNEKKYWTEFF